MNRFAKYTACIVFIFAGSSCGEAVSPKTIEASASLSQAYERFNTLVSEAEAALQSSDYFTSDVARAEAYRYLSGMIAAQLRDQLHFNVDPAYPTLHCVVAIGNKWGFSNPDNLYLAASVSEDFSYRISGRLGSANHTIIGSYSGDDESGVAGQRILGDALQTDDAGNFELIISRTRPANSANWIELVPGATSITIYQVFGDWAKERKGEYRIEAIGFEGTAEPLLSQALVGEQLVRAGRNIRGRVLDWLDVAKRIDRLPDNSFMPAKQIQIASLGSWFEYGNYDVALDEALIIEVDAPVAATYWGLTLYNWWGETLDYKNRQTSLNHSQAKVSSDGKLRVVLAASDPGVENWLDISGHLRGPINWRVKSLVAPENFKTTKVSLSAVREHLPSDTPAFSAQQRRHAIALRQQQIDARYVE